MQKIVVVCPLCRNRLRSPVLPPIGAGLRCPSCNRLFKFENEHLETADAGACVAEAASLHSPPTGGEPSTPESSKANRTSMLVGACLAVSAAMAVFGGVAFFKSLGNGKDAAQVAVDGDDSPGGRSRGVGAVAVSDSSPTPTGDQTAQGGGGSIGVRPSDGANLSGNSGAAPVVPGVGQAAPGGNPGPAPSGIGAPGPNAQAGGPGGPALMVDRGPVAVGRFSLSGDRLATIEHDGTAFLWDPVNNKRLARLGQGEFYKFGVTNVALEFSLDGAHLASAVNPEMLELWDARTGKRIAVWETTKIHGQAVRFSDDGTLCIGCSEHTIYIIDVKTGQLRREPIDVPDLSILSCAIAPDGKTFAVGGHGQDRGEVRLWNAADGTPAGVVPGFVGGVAFTRYSSDGRHLAAMTVAADLPYQWKMSHLIAGDVTVWDVANPAAPALKDKFSIHGAVPTQDGRNLWFYRFDGEPYEKTMQVSWQTFNEGTPTKSAVFQSPQFSMHRLHPESNTLLVSYNGAASPGNPDGMFNLVDAEKGVIRRSFPGETAVGMSYDGRRILTSRGAIVTLADADDVSLASLRTFNHVSGVYDVKFSADDLLLSAVFEKSYTAEVKTTGGVRVWNTHASNAPPRYEIGARKDVSAATVAGDANTLAASAPGQQGGYELSLWDVAGKRRLHVLPNDPFLQKKYTRYRIESLAFSADQNVLASVWSGQTYSIEIWSVGKTARRIRVIEPYLQSNEKIRCAALSPVGDVLVAGTSIGRVLLWDVAEGKSRQTLARHKYTVNAVCISPDGNLLAVAGDSGELDVWKIATGSEHARLKGHGTALYAAAFSADSRLLVAGGEDDFGSAVRVWDVDTGEIAATLSGHRGRVKAVAFAHGKPMLAAGDEKGEVRLWDLSKFVSKGPR